MQNPPYTYCGRRKSNSLFWLGINSCLVGLSALLLFGCNALQTRAEIEQSVPAPEIEEVGPPKPESSVVSPVRVQTQKIPKVGLILGPGGVRAYAHIGVLRALQMARIPVDSIVGLEWGAWVAAYYALEAHPHQAEWSLLKLKDSDIRQEPGLFKSDQEARPIRSLDSFFDNSFHIVDIARMKIPFACPVLVPAQGKVFWQRSGDIRVVLRECLVYPPIFAGGTPGRYAGAGEVAAAAQYLRSQGMEVIILVDVLGGAGVLPGAVKKQDNALPLLYYELAQNLRAARTSVNEVIAIPISSANVLSVEKRRDLIKQGAQVTQQAAQKLSSKYGF